MRFGHRPLAQEVQNSLVRLLPIFPPLQKELRMIRSRLAYFGFLAVISASAHASLLRVDYDLFTAANASQWTSTDPIPESIHATFTVDTHSASSSNLSLQTLSDGSSCLGSFSFQGVSISDLAVTSSSSSFGTGTSTANGRFGGDEPSGRCPNGLFSFLSFSTGDLHFVGSVDFLGMMAADVNASADPFADLLTRAVSRNIDASLRGSWGSLYASGSGTVTSVPEPGTIALFAVALLGFAFRKRIARSAVNF
jgi:hypothetical protein